MRSVGATFAKEDINVNAVLPGFVATGLAPPSVIEAFEKEGHLTPMSSMLKAYDAFIDSSGDELAGQTVEISGEQLYWRRPVEFANESQRFLTEDPKGLWSSGHGRVTEGDKSEVKAT